MCLSSVWCMTSSWIVVGKEQVRMWLGALDSLPAIRIRLAQLALVASGLFRQPELEHRNLVRTGICDIGTMQAVFFA